MTDTLSTQSAITDKLVPTDTDKDPIKWDNNRATIEGKLHEAALYYARTDQFIHSSTTTWSRTLGGNGGSPPAPRVKRLFRKT